MSHLGCRDSVYNYPDIASATTRLTFSYLLSAFTFFVACIVDGT